MNIRFLARRVLSQFSSKPPQNQPPRIFKWTQTGSDQKTDDQEAPQQQVSQPQDKNFDQKREERASGQRPDKYDRQDERAPRGRQPQPFEIRYGSFLKETQQPKQSKKGLKALLAEQPQNYAEILHASGSKYQQYFDQFRRKTDGVDVELFTAYFQCVRSSDASIEEQTQKIKPLIMKDLKAFQQNGEINEYFGLILRGNQSISQRAKQIDDILNECKNQSLKVQFDLTEFLSIYNLQTYDEFKRDYDLMNKVFCEYLNFVVLNNRPKSLIDLNTIFSIIRDFSQRKGYFQKNDPCLSILNCLNGFSYPLEHYISIQELCLWAKQYLENPKGLKPIIQSFEKVSNFIPTFIKVVNDIEKQGGVLRCTNQLKQDYLSFKNLSQSQIEIFALLAARVKDDNLLAELISQGTKNKGFRQQFLYTLSADLITAQTSSKSLVQPLELLFKEASETNSQIPNHVRDFSMVKALIHDNDYNGAINIFKSRIIESSIIGFQREKIRNLLIKYVEAQFGFSTKFDYNPQAIEVRRKVDNLVTTLPQQFLLKLHAEDQTDNAVVEALTFSDDPWKFWEQIRKMERFYALRGAILRQKLNIRPLINPVTESDHLNKEIFDNYLSYLEMEKIRRVKDRRLDRISHLLDRMTTIGLVAKSDFEIVSDINEHITEEVLDRKIFGKGEDEFPDIEKYLEYKEKIRMVVEEPDMFKHPQIVSANLDVGFERRQIEKDIEDYKVPYEPFEVEKGSDEEEQLQQGDQQLPDLETKDQVKQFIRQFFQPFADEEDWGNTEQNPLRMNDKPYGAKYLNQKHIEEMRWRYYNAYQDHNQFANGPASKVQDEIWSLMAWGIEKQQPLGIKLGEFYSEYSGVPVPQYLAKRIAQFYKYEVKQPHLVERFDLAYKHMGPSNYNKAYIQMDPVFQRAGDLDLLKRLECTHQFKGVARALLHTTYSNQRYRRYGVTFEDIKQLYQSQH